MKMITAIVAAVAISLCGCQQLKDFYNRPETQAQITQLEQFVIAAATDYLNGSLKVSGKRLTARHYSKEFVKQQVIASAQVKFPNLTRAQITAVVDEKFK